MPVFTRMFSFIKTFPLNLSKMPVFKKMCSYIKTFLRKFANTPKMRSYIRVFSRKSSKNSLICQKYAHISRLFRDNQTIICKYYENMLIYQGFSLILTTILSSSNVTQNSRFKRTFTTFSGKTRSLFAKIIPVFAEISVIFAVP